MYTRLNEFEVRVIGSLVEKEVATPDYYPLTLNGLVHACNQKNNRNPVVGYDEETVTRALNWKSPSGGTPSKVAALSMDSALS